jgi:large subunit ribosomal protein L18
VFKSNKHFYAQVIDDTKGITIASVSDVEKGVKRTPKPLWQGPKSWVPSLESGLKAKKVKTIVFRSKRLYLSRPDQRVRGRGSRSWNSILRG